MVRKTPSGFFYSQDAELPYRVARGYDRVNVGHSAYSSSTTSLPRYEEQKPIKKDFDPSTYTLPYVSFMTENPTIFHAVDTLTKKLEKHGYEYLNERSLWDIKAGGKYYTKRNDSSFIAFAVGKDYKPGNGIGIVAGHIDALTVKLKPVSKVPNKAGFIQMGVAPYAGGMNSTWWDRDLGIGGRVLVRTSSGKIETKLVNLGWPIARIPTLAPHFGAAAMPPFNPETQMVPIIGIDNSDLYPETAKKVDSESKIKAGTFAATQPPKLVETICGRLGIQDYSDVVNWELELFDIMPAQLGGLDQEFIFAGRIDDKLCCFAAIEALIASEDSASSGIIKMVGCFDDEEIGSYLRQGARSNFMESTISRIVETTSGHGSAGPNLKGQVLANTFLVSSDVIHAVNPNFLGAYLENHSPRLNVGVAVSADPNGHMTTDSVSTALLQRIADKCGSILQVFQIRNDSRSGGTIGPMTSSQLGCRAIDCGIPQLSMHSVRATTGSLDPGLGVKLYKGFFDHYEEVDQEFQPIDFTRKEALPDPTEASKFTLFEDSPVVPPNDANTRLNTRRKSPLRGQVCPNVLVPERSSSSIPLELRSEVAPLLHTQWSPPKATRGLPKRYGLKLRTKAQKTQPEVQAEIRRGERLWQVEARERTNSLRQLKKNCLLRYGLYI